MPRRSRLSGALLGIALVLAWSAPLPAASAREETFGDWSVRCEKRSEEVAEHCYMFQFVFLGKSDGETRKQRVLDARVAYTGSDQPPVLAGPKSTCGVAKSPSFVTAATTLADSRVELVVICRLVKSH